MKQRCYMDIMPISACNAIPWTSWSFWVVLRALLLRTSHSLMIKEWVIVCRPSKFRTAHKKKVCKGLPGYNCHLLLKTGAESSERPPKLCINLKYTVEVQLHSEVKMAGLLVPDVLNIHSHFILSTLSLSVILLIQTPTSSRNWDWSLTASFCQFKAKRCTWVSSACW